MQIIRNILDKDFNFSLPTTLTIGNFDGVHRGHTSIIERMHDLSSKTGTLTVVVTFEPHPVSVLTPEIPIKLLSVGIEKIKLLEKKDVSATVLIPFNAELSQNSAEWFLNEVLLKKLNARHIVIGINHTFGKDREGNVDYLKKHTLSKGVELYVVEPVIGDGTMVSSSTVRSELERGDFEKAIEMLGHSYPLFGKVISGMGIGKTLGYPTINIEVDKRKLLPPSGVYACMVSHKNQEIGGMLYVGTRPTFGGTEKAVEISCFCSLDVSIGDDIEAYVLKRFRDDRKFGSKDELVNQLKRDEEEIASYLMRNKIRLTIS